MVVVHKDIKVMRGQQHLFDKQKYFFSITNELKEDVPAREVIRNGNQRCDQENTISQGKACGALAAPLDTLESKLGLHGHGFACVDTQALERDVGACQR